MTTWMRTLAIGFCLSLWSLSAWCARPTPVLLISIDGLRPGDVREADQRNLRIPTLRRFLKEGAYATGVQGVRPTLTYPSHTTMLTGVAPARHGIYSNITFDPTLKNQQGWYWYASDIRVPTLWDVSRAAGLTTANVHWPVSVGANVQYNLPQVWRTGMPDDRKLLRALATPGLIDTLERDLGPYADGIDESIEGDENRARFAQRLIQTRHPDFMTAYFTALDHTQHLYGPDTPQARAVLERIDTIVAHLLEAMRKSDPRAVVCIVSDHGFASLHHDVNIIGAFVDAGLIRFDARGQVTHWEAAPWFAAGSAAIVLRNPKDMDVRKRVSDVLDRLRADADNGIAAVLDRSTIAAQGGNPDAEFYLDFAVGYEMAPDPKSPPVGPSVYRGMHGYAPNLPEMRSTFLISGGAIAAGRSLGDIDMRDIAPTLASLLKIKLPNVEGKPLL